MENKQTFIGQLMAGKTDALEMEDVSAVTFNPSLFKQVAEDIPQKAAFMKLKMSLKQLGASRNRFYESQSTVEMEKKKEFFETRMTGTKADIQTVHDHFEYPFRIDVLYQDVAKTFTEDDKSSEIGEFLAKRLEGNILENNFNINKGVGKMKLADYRGFEILRVVGKTSDNGYETLILRGKSDYSLQVDINAPTGILTRIDNKLTKGIKDDLERTTMECERLQSNIDGILEEKGKPYPKEQEFLDKKARYDELKIELTGKTMKKNVSNEHSSSMSM
ncbi:MULTISPECIES: hypothetical protein [unclassified Lactococcus]|uniref:hypothetical protein n=1 Tax=unclassified Lactococcus TaxID=2643510 RepID=UPI0011C8DD0E|nr:MULTISPECIES: hypothetical protein [unclassified Lactococcus]MQW24025.1 hypothetical protein [Lactococcus sp. dk101]TXK36606.1 hypothetical protein FVP42_11040 [Lactococcus sp. dk310]TXK46918.1 hypothetical protein FVP43_10645 [Lactococcus sp. dk322]